uniref:Uncharacterized protein n=1 Tax=Eptatretus burgeri TaxID=7764 RepID=A0A8C4NFY1_EPTBU
MVQPTSTIASAILQQRERWQRKFICTSRELVATEQRYCMQLNLLITVSLFLIWKSAAELQPPPLDPTQYGWKLDEASKSLLPIMLPPNVALAPPEILELIRCGCSSDKQCYTTQCRCTAIQMKKNKAFARFKRLQESRPDCQGLMLEDLLATQVMFKASQRNLEHLQRIQSMLKSHRVYIREGWLFVAPRKGENLKERLFFLFSDMLLMCRQCHPFHPVHEGKLECQAAFPLLKGSVTKSGYPTRIGAEKLIQNFQHSAEGRYVMMVMIDEELSLMLRQVNIRPEKQGPHRNLHFLYVSLFSFIWPFKVWSLFDK